MHEFCPQHDKYEERKGNRSVRMHAVKLITGMCLVAVETHCCLQWLKLSSVTAG